VADAANKLSLDSQRFQKDKSIAFLHRISVYLSQHCMNLIGLRETQVLTLYVECCRFIVPLINILAALGIAGIVNELNC
jgi:hypothetical protein